MSIYSVKEPYLNNGQIVYLSVYESNYNKSLILKTQFNRHEDDYQHDLYDEYYGYGVKTITIKQNLTNWTEYHYVVDSENIDITVKKIQDIYNQQQQLISTNIYYYYLYNSEYFAINGDTIIECRYYYNIDIKEAQIRKHNFNQCLYANFYLYDYYNNDLSLSNTVCFSKVYKFKE